MLEILEMKCWKFRNVLEMLVILEMLEMWETLEINAQYAQCSQRTVAGGKTLGERRDP